MCSHYHYVFCIDYYYCNNTEGSNNCYCQSGYHLLADNVTCRGINLLIIMLILSIDINECLMRDNICPAMHVCTNTIGSYSCSLCGQGYNYTGSNTCSGTLYMHVPNIILQ